MAIEQVEPHLAAVFSVPHRRKQRPAIPCRNPPPGYDEGTTIAKIYMEITSKDQEIICRALDSHVSYLAQFLRDLEGGDDYKAVKKDLSESEELLKRMRGSK